jgi:predicted nuclease of restriction endonuclease-like (RecB) superfamily
LPWGHNVRLLDKVSSVEERLWYVHGAIEHGGAETYSRSISRAAFTVARARP